MPQFHVRNNDEGVRKLIMSFRWHSSMSADATHRIRRAVLEPTGEGRFGRLPENSWDGAI
jgi:hypothetical protein